MTCMDMSSAPLIGEVPCLCLQVIQSTPTVTPDVHQDPLDLTLDEFPTLGLVSKSVTEDKPKFGQAMNGLNAEFFWYASIKENSALQKLKSWTQVKRLQGMNDI